MRCSLRMWVLLASALLFFSSLLFSLSLRGASLPYLDPPGWEMAHRVKLVPSYAGIRRLDSPEGALQRTCACQSCVGDPGVSDWFDENYDPDISPMLQPQFKPHNMQQVLSKLFEVIPGRSPYGSWDPARCQRCAVVGNSGNLRGVGYGRLIDGHQFIMSTYAPVKQFLRVDKDKVN
ncbi:UNVERIFIED_CONTAM: hypothetical protein FKN15_061306 [Acipenser sinensis]